MNTEKAAAYWAAIEAERKAEVLARFKFRNPCPDCEIEELRRIGPLYKCDGCGHFAGRLA